MKRLLSISVLIGWLVILGGCVTPKLYTSPDFETYRETHRTIAILPFTVTIDSKKLPKNFTIEMAREAEKEEGYNLQRTLYSRFLQKYQKGEYTIEFQDLAKTNSIFAGDSITYDQISDFDKGAICRRLGVDAVISGSVYRERPMSTALAVGLGVLFGVWGSTNHVNANLSVHEATQGELVWSYDHSASGSVGSSTEQLAEHLMKSVSKRFPYKLIEKK